MADIFFYNSTFKNNTEDFKAYFDSVQEVIAPDQNDLDVALDLFVRSLLNKAYHNIFIPASIGQVVSDFLGLRLALHIRTTNCPAKLANIYVYGAESLEEIASNCDLYQILLTKGTRLISYDLASVILRLKKPIILKDQHDLSAELRLLKLQIPGNYYDDHSIANLWGMFRLCEVAGISIDALEQVRGEKAKLSNIYFKWISTINNKPVRTEEVKAVEMDLKVKLPGLRLTGQKIDVTKFSKR